LVVYRTWQWRLRYATGEHSDWSSKKKVDELLDTWNREADTKRKAASTEAETARKEFIAGTELSVVSVRNPNPFQVDYRKPTLTFPDGFTQQFEEGTSKKEIEQAVDAAAAEAYPDLASIQEQESPELEDRPVWERELITGGERQSFPETSSWNHAFPMEDVAKTLDELAREGWTVLQASEDRGLYESELAKNMSAPVCVRYLLEGEAAGSPAR